VRAILARLGLALSPDTLGPARARRARVHSPLAPAPLTLAGSRGSPAAPTVVPPELESVLTRQRAADSVQP
jgi:hypothetical protein